MHYFQGMNVHTGESQEHRRESGEGFNINGLVKIEFLSCKLLSAAPFHLMTSKAISDKVNYIYYL